MSVKPKGGRGQKAPYRTIQMRVPVPLKVEFQERIDSYREAILTGNKPEDRYLLLKDAIASVIADPAVTRSGKDGGAVKRAFNALLEKLGCA